MGKPVDKTVRETDKGLTSQDIEQRPDGWERFEKAVDAAVKGRSQRKAKTAQATPKVSK